MNREQKLIDIMFEIAFISAKYNHGKNNRDIAKWIKKQLKDCGFEGKSIGSSWFVLDE